MYVKRHVVRKMFISIMVDTGATHNFIFEGKVKKFSLKLKKDSWCMKVVNSEDMPPIVQDVLKSFENVMSNQLP